MIQHQGIWLPDGELHLQGWMDRAGEIVDGRGSYQIEKLRKSLAHVRQFRTAIDAGGHVGMWAMQLAKRFERTEVFEPVARHRECFDANIANLRADGFTDGIVNLHAAALGDHEGLIRIESAPGSSGDSRVAGDGDIPLVMMDSFGFTDVDFIKLDCEGYEFFALKGGAQTIARDLPVICVEQKPGRGQRFGLRELAAVEWLQDEFGYRCAKKLSGDYVMVPG